MGHVISATCKCGYTEKNLTIGGGMLDFQVNCGHPALCSTGEHVVTVNLLKKPITCPEGHSGFPSPYCNSPDLQIEPGLSIVSGWQDYELNDGKYLCPKCGAYELVFSTPHIFFD